ncbi:hypothetical protein ASPVEDRAFT_70708 [Aspergillus versicolor CBS 583.65]|uniref:Uncharacterized protein n=1 Tax=Aspergillus versicolor CBS 583.65 TaxID=1036611 RepID=A0A1L9PG47_ASPVE|nr:uncharacterized protein ASPVEDRAFT_70708 [Aspergillus versicolor CBS 583.65]OJJ00489.1 hypothetical protein ASPVEDRAFT_70708 [Aspergillus versicolor CBS 583.65]
MDRCRHKRHTAALRRMCHLLAWECEKRVHAYPKCSNQCSAKFSPIKLPPAGYPPMVFPNVAPAEFENTGRSLKHGTCQVVETLLGIYLRRAKETAFNRRPLAQSYDPLFPGGMLGDPTDKATDKLTTASQRRVSPEAQSSSVFVHPSARLRQGQSES